MSSQHLFKFHRLGSKKGLELLSSSASSNPSYPFRSFGLNLRSIATCHSLGRHPQCSCGSCVGFKVCGTSTEGSPAVETRPQVRKISTQRFLFHEYNVPEEIAPTKSVTSSIFGGNKFEGNKRRGESPLTQKLVLAKTPEEVLHVLENEMETETSDPISVSVAVDLMFDTLKNESSLPIRTKHRILTSVGMQKLCKLVRRHSPHMDPADLINGVKLLGFLCVPGNHQTFQILLKLLSKHANNLDLQQLAYMQFLLDKLHLESKSSLSKALEVALPVVFESKLSSQLERNDPNSICDYLHYATKYQLSDKSISLLIETALRITDKFSVAAAKSIFWSLCDLNFNHPSHEPLVTWCFRKMTESIDEFKVSELNTTVGKAVRKFHPYRAPYFYNEDFMNAYCLRNSQNVDSPETTLWAIKSSSLMRHVNIELLDRVGEIIATNPSYILNNDHLFTVIVRGFSILNYKPEKWSSFSSILLEHPSLTKNQTIYDVPLALDFLALDLFPETMIRKFYSSDGLPILEEYFGRFQNPFPLILLYNAVKTLYPDYRGLIPPISMIEQWKEASRAAHANKNYPLKPALQTGLGGESYVINGLYHDGLHIDHGIVMRKGGYPVAVNSQSDSQSDCLSSITKPPESIMILIKVWNKEFYANNTRRLRGGAALELKILESLGHPVVSVDLESWMEMPDFEKIPYLMQRIREKMEHLQWNQNWGDVIPP